MKLTWDYLRRIRYDLTLFLILLFGYLLVPSSWFPSRLDMESGVNQAWVAKMNMLLWLLNKGLCVSAGIINAHIVRKTAFYYIDFSSTDLRWYHAIMIVMIYSVIPYLWARGG